MNFTVTCPHCKCEGTHVVDPAALAGLLTDRVLPVECKECSARFVVNFHVRAQTLVSVLHRPHLLDVRQKGQQVARAVKRSRKTQGQGPDVSCAGCERRYGKSTGYPEPLATEGLCSVCAQEVKRRLAKRARRAA